jgi:hypothetical protein
VKPYYKDGLVTLYHGDCREQTAWLEVDVLLVDPPYGHAGIANDHDTGLRDWILDAWGDRPAIVFGAWSAPFPAHKQVLVWRKPVDAGVLGSVTGYRRDTELIFLTGPWPKRTAARSSVLETDRGRNSYTNGHPHAKPADLLGRLLEWTTGTIADPTCGTGAALVAAKHSGRRAIGVELEERYCEVAAKRLSQDTLFAA